MMPRIIAIYGRKGSGKTTLAEGLGRSLDWGVRQGRVHRLSFAQPLRAVAEEMLVQSRAAVDGRHARELLTTGKDRPLMNGITGRDLLLRLGPFFDLLNPRWREDAMARAVKAADPDGIIIIDDMRVPGEHEAVRLQGGVMVRLRRGEDDPPANHLEGRLDGGYDFDIDVPAHFSAEATLAFVRQHICRAGAR